MLTVNSCPVFLDEVHTGVFVSCACFYQCPGTPCRAEIATAHVQTPALCAQAYTAQLDRQWLGACASDCLHLSLVLSCVGRDRDLSVLVTANHVESGM